MASSRNHGTRVPPLSKKLISDVTERVRSIMRINTPLFPIVQVYEVLHYLVDDAYFEIRDASEMGDDHGRTYPDKGVILIREDVYDGASAGKPRDRFTLAHELAHLILHRGISFARVDPNNPPKIYMNSEWQADVFASYLLMPSPLVSQYSDVSEVVQAFGVSHEAAYAREAEFMCKIVK